MGRPGGTAVLVSDRGQGFDSPGVLFIWSIMEVGMGNCTAMVNELVQSIFSPPRPPACLWCGRERSPVGHICRQCYLDPEVHRIYHPAREIQKRAKRTIKPASRATTAAPGSPEKVQILESRFAAGEQLWHPEDRSDRAK